MLENNPVSRELTKEDFDKIKSLATRQDCKKGELIFSEGDVADYIYFIKSDRVSIFIRKFTVRRKSAYLDLVSFSARWPFFTGRHGTHIVSAEDYQRFLEENL